MGNQEVFKYVLPDGTRGVFTLEDISKMNMPTFMYYKDYFVNVRDTIRYDMAVYEKATITPLHTHQLFRNGVGQEEKYATSDTEFTKTKLHTNMGRKGEVPQGGLWVIYDISAPITFYAGKPTSIDANGAISNAKASFVATNDPAIIADAWGNQVELKYMEGDDEDGIVKGLLKDFAPNSGLSGALGSSVGGFVQNAMIPNVNLRSPRVLEGGQDFTVLLTPVCNFDTTNATGIDQIIRQKVELRVIELVKRSV